jgi:hypothetical protein
MRWSMETNIRLRPSEGPLSREKGTDHCTRYQGLGTTCCRQEEWSTLRSTSSNGSHFRPSMLSCLSNTTQTFMNTRLVRLQVHCAEEVDSCSQWPSKERLDRCHKHLICAFNERTDGVYPGRTPRRDLIIRPGSIDKAALSPYLDGMEENSASRRWDVMHALVPQ